MAGKTFLGIFTRQEPIPEPAIERAIGVMRSGRLHCYNIADCELIGDIIAEEFEAARSIQDA